MKISVLEWGGTVKETEIWEGGGHGDGQVFSFCQGRGRDGNAGCDPI